MAKKFCNISSFFFVCLFSSAIPFGYDLLVDGFFSAFDLVPYIISFAFIVANLLLFYAPCQRFLCCYCCCCSFMCERAAHVNVNQYNCFLVMIEINFIDAECVFNAGLPILMI